VESVLFARYAAVGGVVGEEGYPADFGCFSGDVGIFWRAARSSAPFLRNGFGVGGGRGGVGGPGGV